MFSFSFGNNCLINHPDLPTVHNTHTHTLYAQKARTHACIFVAFCLRSTATVKPNSHDNCENMHMKASNLFH